MRLVKMAACVVLMVAVVMCAYLWTREEEGIESPLEQLEGQTIDAQALEFIGPPPVPLEIPTPAPLEIPEVQEPLKTPVSLEIPEIPEDGEPTFRLPPEWGGVRQERFGLRPGSPNLYRPLVPASPDSERRLSPEAIKRLKEIEERYQRNMRRLEEEKKGRLLNDC